MTTVASALLSCTKVCIYVHIRRNRQLASRHTEGMNDFVIPQHCGVPGTVLYSGQVGVAAGVNSSCSSTRDGSCNGPTRLPLGAEGAAR